VILVWGRRRIVRLRTTIRTRVVSWFARCVFTPPLITHDHLPSSILIGDPPATTVVPRAAPLAPPFPFLTFDSLAFAEVTLTLVQSLSLFPLPFLVDSTPVMLTTVTLDAFPFLTFSSREFAFTVEIATRVPVAISRLAFPWPLPSVVGFWVALGEFTLAMLAAVFVPLLVWSVTLLLLAGLAAVFVPCLLSAAAVLVFGAFGKADNESGFLLNIWKWRPSASLRRWALLEDRLLLGPTGWVLLSPLVALIALRRGRVCGTHA
jgi:hypothetical protein